MKCIHCGTHTVRWVRRDGRCRKCGHAFAFDPARDPFPVRDAAFQDAVARVSFSGRLHFTARQLWYELTRERARRSAWDHLASWSLPLGVGGAPALGMLGVVEIPMGPLVGLGVVAGVGMMMFFDSFARDAAPRPPRPPRIPFDVFRARFLERWAAVHGPLERLVADPAPDAAPREVPADVAAFSFDRAVVAQHAEIAAMLVANRFHFENGCAVLSLDGYPFGFAETVKEMLRRNPRLTVFAVHDASAEGAALPLALRGPAWFPARAVRIVDAGIRRHDGLGRVPVLPGPPVKLPDPLRKELPPADAAWLEAGNRVELAVLGPTELMRMIQRAFAVMAVPDRPDHLKDVKRATSAGGIILASALPLPAGDTAATDGFG